MIRLAPLEVVDAERAVAALTPAFLDGPTMLWCFGGASAGYAERVAGYFRVGHRWHRGGGHPAMGAFVDGAVVGACYVADPGVDATPDDVRALEAELIGACGEPWAERFASYNRVVEEARPSGRLHTLAIIGVHPDHQGRGVGKALVDWACELSDADPASEGIVLDTGSAANVGFYSSFGFAPVAQVPLGDGGGHVLLRRRRDGGMKPALDSDRLHLRPAGAADLERLHGLWTDPDMRRHLFDDHPISLEEARDLLERSDAGFAERGLGLWCADERNAGNLVGFAGFLHSDDEPDLVYGLRSAHWGRGLATEAARRVIEHAFSNPAAERIVASVDEPNQASIRVLERLGMRRTRRSVVDGKPLLYYALERGGV